MKPGEFEYALPKGTVLRSPKHAYKVEDVLGVGGFGVTYKVSATILYENVPISAYFTIKEHFLADICDRDPANPAQMRFSKPSRTKVEESRSDFLAEARRLRDISGKNPHIVPVNEVFEANNTAYYVMEYIDGGNLRDRVGTGGPLTEAEAVGQILQIADAVEFLHSRRINHLDIKPDNIMFKASDDGSLRPMLIDFGLAKHFDENGKPTSTIRVQGCSDGYAPMEQYAGLRRFSPQADVYALGATLYYMLVGKDPAISTELTAKKIEEALPASVSPAVRNAITSAMAQRSADRLPSAAAFMRMLSPEAADPAVAAISASAKTGSGRQTQVIEKGRTDRKKRRKQIIALTAGIATSLVVAIGIILFFTHNNRTTAYMDDDEEEKYYENQTELVDTALPAEPVDTAAYDYSDLPVVNQIRQRKLQYEEEVEQNIQTPPPSAPKL